MVPNYVLLISLLAAQNNQAQLAKWDRDVSWAMCSRSSHGKPSCIILLYQTAQVAPKCIVLVGLCRVCPKPFVGLTCLYNSRLAMLDDVWY